MLAALAARRAGVPLLYTPHGRSFEQLVSRLCAAPMPVRAPSRRRFHAESSPSRPRGRGGRALARRGARPDPRHLTGAGADCLAGPRGRQDCAGPLADETLAVWVGRSGPQSDRTISAPVARRLRGDARVLAVCQARTGPARARAALRGVLLAAPDVDPPLAYAAADSMLHTSDREAAPLAVLEAMAAGLPVIAYDVGGVGEQVQAGRTASWWRHATFTCSPTVHSRSCASPSRETEGPPGEACRRALLLRGHGAGPRGRLQRRLRPRARLLRPPSTWRARARGAWSGPGQSSDGARRSPPGSAHRGLASRRPPESLAELAPSGGHGRAPRRCAVGDGRASGIIGLLCLWDMLAVATALGLSGAFAPGARVLALLPMAGLWVSRSAWPGPIADLVVARASDRDARRDQLVATATAWAAVHHERRRRFAHSGHGARRHLARLPLAWYLGRRSAAAAWRTRRRERILIVGGGEVADKVLSLLGATEVRWWGPGRWRRHSLRVPRSETSTSSPRPGRARGRPSHHRVQRSS